MKLFGLGKKPGDMKTLSEKEIQVKLYGHLRSPHAGATHDAAVITLPKAQPRPAIVHPQSQTLTRDERKNVTISSTGETTGAPRPSYMTPKPKEEPAEAARPKAMNKPFQSTKPKAAAFTKFASAAAGKILPAVWAVVKAALTFIAQLLVAAIGMITQIFLKIDFKNPRVRRVFSWTFGIGLLAFVLVGIHMLNVKREFAMKHPNRTVSVKPKPRAKAQIPNQVTSQTLISESAAETASERALTAAESAITAATAPSAVTAPAATSETPVVSQKGQVIQIATFAAQTDAEKLVERLKADGWKCFVKPLVRPGGKTYYCVFLGAYKTSQEAETKLAAFKKKEIAKPFQDAFIRSL